MPLSKCNTKRSLGGEHREVTGPTARQARGPFRIEEIESRCLFSIIPVMNDSFGIQIQGTPFNDVVIVSLSGDRTTVIVEVASGDTPLERFEFDSFFVRSVVIDLGDGADNVNLFGDTEGLGTFPFDQLAVVNTGAGNDNVRLGSGLSRVNTGDGDDFVIVFGSPRIDTGAGNDELRFERGWKGGSALMGEGDDTIFAYEGGAPGASPFVIRGGPGNDLLDLYEFADSLFFPFFGGERIDSLELARWQYFELDMRDYPDTENALNVLGLVTVIGNDRDNLITTEPGDPLGVTLFGMGGNDTIYGARGDDSLVGGAGDDVTYAGEGNDRIEGNAGRDRLEGGNGDDSLFGGPGGDLLLGGFGNDSYDPGGGRDIIFDIDNNTPAADLFALNPRDRGAARAVELVDSGRVVS